MKCEIYYLLAKYDFSILLENKVLAVKDLLKLSEQRYFNKILGNKPTKNILNSFSRKIIYDRIPLDKNDSLSLNRILKDTKLYKKYIWKIYNPKFILKFKQTILNFKCSWHSRKKLKLNILYYNKPKN